MTEEVEATEALIAPKKAPRVFKVQTLIDTDQLQKDLAYSMANLSDAMMNQAALNAHYGVLAGRAGRQHDMVKLLLEQAEARVYKMERDAAAKLGEKVTEALLEKRVAVHPTVVEYKKALNEAKYVESLCKTAFESFRHRRDMLVSQGMISREEMKGELSIGRKREADAAIEDQKARFAKRLAENAS